MRTLVRVIYVLIGSVAIFWWLANETQRRTLLEIAGLVPPPARPPATAAPPPPLPELPKPPPPVETFRDTVCIAPTRAPSDAEKPAMYSWRDADGRLVFGDRAPQGVAVEDVGDRYRAREQFVTVAFVDRGARFGPQLQSAIGRDVDVMSRILRAGLDLDVRQIDLKLTLVSSDEQLREGANATSAAMENLAGYYQRRENAVTLKEQGTFDATRRVARHEATHAMMAGIFGATPLWLNEGLAEMMESLDLAGQRRTAKVHRRHAEAVAGQFQRFDGAALPTLFDMTPAQWSANPSELTYARAWSLTHFLMSSRDGQDFIDAVLGAQLERPCQRLDSMLIANTHYPGGARALAQQWQEHARFDLWQPVRF